jgi:L-rhamnono-1,4-lactonase
VYLDHLCKPDLTIYNLVADPSFHAWRTAIYTLGKCSNTYMKLSGAFSELPPGIKTQSPSHIFQATLGWLGVVLATFGPSRIMFGSDWPVCTPGVEDAWARWRDVVEKMCWMATLSDEERAMIFGGTAKKAYGL